MAFRISRRVGIKSLRPRRLLWLEVPYPIPNGVLGRRRNAFLRRRFSSRRAIARKCAEYGTAAALIVAAAAENIRAQQTDSNATKLPTVVVTRDARRSPLDLPYAITSTRPDSTVPGITRTQVEQVLAFIPGVTLANRGNPSQDARISIRGFGARSAFGVRSLKIMRDGMPLTLPDGQTPIDYLDLEGVGSIETIRGTASALYGNAAGGVIDIRSVGPPMLP